MDVSRVSDPHTPARPRRTFIEWRELPGLLARVPRGDAVALRRVLGARRGGRIGAALATGLSLLAAVDAVAALAGVATYAALAALTAAKHRGEGLGGYRALRLLLWTIPIPLSLAALARGLGWRSRLFLPLAALLGWALLERGLRNGLAGAPGQSAGAAGVSGDGRTSVGTGSPGRE